MAGERTGDLLPDCSFLSFQYTVAVDVVRGQTAVGTSGCARFCPLSLNRPVVDM